MKLKNILIPACALVITWAWTSTQSLFACTVKDPKQLYYAIDLDHKRSFSYDDKEVLSGDILAEVHGCEATRGKNFLMFAIGPELVKMGGESAISYNGHVRDDRCRIEPSPFEKPTNFENINNDFQRRYKFFNQCIGVYIEHLGNNPIKYPTNQPGCTVERVNDRAIKFYGGYCFVQPTFDSAYTAHMIIRPECADEAHLQSLGLGPMEMNARLNIYTAGDASGSSPDLTQIGRTKIRVSINPTEKYMPVSDSFEAINPVWPAEWASSDVHFGEIMVEKSSELQDRIKLNLVSDNHCKKTCHGAACSSPCDYSSPVVAEFNLEEINPRTGKRVFLKSWYDGGVASPEWQGVIEGMGTELPGETFASGKRYVVTANFYDPKTDFEIFRGRILKRVGHIRRAFPHINEDGAGVGEIPEIPMVRPTDTMPIFSEIDGIFFNGVGVRDPLLRAIYRFNTYLNVRFWPPYYESVCNQNRDVCVHNPKQTARLELFFDVGQPLDVDGQPVDARNFSSGRFELKNMRVTRDSKIMAKYDKNVNSLPKLVCE